MKYLGTDILKMYRICMLMNKLLIKETYEIWKDFFFLFSWIAGLSIVKMSIRPKLIYRFIRISIKISRFFVELDKIAVNFK